MPELPHPDQRRRHPRYRRECNGPFGPQGRIVGARNCRQQLARLPCQPVGSERLLRIQQDLLARLRRPRDGPIEPIKAFWDLYELLFRLAIYLGTPEMLPTGTDAHLWWTFHEFCQLRDQLALTAGPTARERCGDLLSYQPGPLLSAAAMLTSWTNAATTPGPAPSGTNTARTTTPPRSLLITVVHPVITSHEARQSTNEARTSWVVDDYFHTGARQRNWLGNTVTWYHRTIEDYVAALTRAQFAITTLRECAPRHDRFEGDMAEFARRRRVPLFLLLAGSRA